MSEKLHFDASEIDGVLKRPDLWYKRGKSGEQLYCNACAQSNPPIQLINVERAKRPFGSSFVSPENPQTSGCVLAGDNLIETASFIATKQKCRRPLSDLSRQMIRIAVENFDHAASVLHADMGIHFSNNVAGSMLDAWFSAQGYAYYAANLKNIPWMIAYFAVSTNLCGQYLKDKALAEAITKHIPEASISQEGQLVRRKAFVDLRFSVLKHRFTGADEHDAAQESVTLLVNCFRDSYSPLDAVRLYEKPIIIDPTKFERRTLMPANNGRNEKLLEIARDTARRHNFDF